MTPAETATLDALRAAGWNQTAAARLLGVAPACVGARVKRSPTLAAAWREHAQKSWRSGRPPKHACRTLEEIRAALAAHGTYAAAARALGMTFQGVGAWVRRFPELRKVMG